TDAITFVEQRVDAVDLSLQRLETFHREDRRDAIGVPAGAETQEELELRDSTNRDQSSARSVGEFSQFLRLHRGARHERGPRGDWPSRCGGKPADLILLRAVLLVVETRGNLGHRR